MAIITAALAFILTTHQPGEVSVPSLMEQMWDYRYLTHPPQPAFLAAQASSYDRASNPGPKADAFANGDAGQFIRQEENAGRTEDVMADLSGPGAVVRLWSANPSGTIRFYFDDEATPRIAADMAKLMTGGDLFPAPFAYEASRGTNVYFPIPYVRHLKITVEGSRGLYYHVGYRSYAVGTAVRTFSPSDLGGAATEMQEAAGRLRLREPAMPKDLQVLRRENVTVRPGQRYLAFDSSRAGTVRELSILAPVSTDKATANREWSDPRSQPQLMRNLLLEAECDGEKTILAPVGDFFSSAPGINPVKTMAFTVSPEGRMSCRLPMPFRKGMKIWLRNVGSVPLVTGTAVRWENSAPAPDTWLLHAQWLSYYGSTRPMRDLEYLDVTGKGMFVGSNLHISNPTVAWWGEGDEKVYVDGETFPSTFGTGTEDYYGYAWSSSERFEQPFHSQNRSDGPGNFGNSNVNRWQLFDPIPFMKSLKMDLEMWHWQEVKAGYARTVFWYAAPGGTAPRPIDRSQLAPPEVARPRPVAGALEGEHLSILRNTGGAASKQDGFWDISGESQLWWVDNKPGEQLALSIPVPKAGRYEIFGNFCYAVDYGIHRLTLNGKALAPIDFYSPALSWKKQSLGVFELPAGTAELVVECIGNHPKAEPRRMFGLDYLLLVPKR